MKFRQITVTEATRNFSELVARIHCQEPGALFVKGGQTDGPKVSGQVPEDRQGVGRALADAGPLDPD